MYSDLFSELIEIYKVKDIEFNHLKPITVAMWILESGRGSSGLAEQHLNFAGMKYRTELDDIAKRVLYAANDGNHYYCEFENLDDFINGFWRFLDRSPYKGWRELALDEVAFIRFVGPIWAQDPEYAGKVLRLREEASDLLNSRAQNDRAESDVSRENDTHNFILNGDRDFYRSPDGKVLISEAESHPIEYRGSDLCPYSRSATAQKKVFDSIILHHNDPRHSLDWYVQYQLDGDPVRGGHFGYHFYVAIDGRIVQGAPLDKRTNHFSSPTFASRRNALFRNNYSNSSAIGISCVGAAIVRNGISIGSSPSVPQIEAVELLAVNLCNIFDISFKDVFGHGEVQTTRHINEGRPMALTIRSWADRLS